MTEMRILPTFTPYIPLLGTTKAQSGIFQHYQEQLHQSSSRDHGPQKIDFPSGHYSTQSQPGGKQWMLLVEPVFSAHSH